MLKFPEHLLKLVETLKRFPGVGKKSAERFAFQMINWRADQLQEFAQIVNQIPEKLAFCHICGCLMGNNECCFCTPERENLRMMCIISTSKDVFALEETHEYKGVYHVLGTLLSPIEGIGPERLKVNIIKDRIRKLSIKEVIMALDATLEGDATALYLKSELETLPVRVSRLAFGLPMGSSFDYVDGSTLAKALSGRREF